MAVCPVAVRWRACDGARLGDVVRERDAGIAGERQQDGRRSAHGHPWNLGDEGRRVKGGGGAQGPTSRSASRSTAYESGATRGASSPSSATVPRGRRRWI